MIRDIFVLTFACTYVDTRIFTELPYAIDTVTTELLKEEDDDINNYRLARHTYDDSLKEFIFVEDIDLTEYIDVEDNDNDGDGDSNISYIDSDDSDDSDK
jgi:hypothetical protein